MKCNELYIYMTLDSKPHTQKKVLNWTLTIECFSIVFLDVRDEMKTMNSLKRRGIMEAQCVGD